jgi:alkanesulfonate monooxygenase SsuD/methylene tetrahydromethanopterin reductase-like flavin-dependent oxidoreductase (luciferase family)
LQYDRSVQGPQWVMLVYRLPRTPSTPRITLWRKLRRLGVAQIVDGVVALPAGRDNRERLEWLADDVVQSGGEATIWISQPVTAAEHRALAETLTERVDAEYQAIAAEAQAAHDGSPVERRRTLARLRRELRRVGARQYFPTCEAGTARKAVDDLARAATEAAA